MAFTKATFDYLDSGGLINWQLTAKTATFDAVSGEGYLVDTSSAAVTVTLPDAPSAGDEIIIVDYASNAGTNNITLDPGTLNLRGTTDDLVLSTNNQTARLLYSGATKGWLVTTEAGGGDDNSTTVYSSGVDAYSSGNTTDGFYNIQLTGWSSPKSVYCDMTNDGGGWMLWAQRLSSGATIDIRYAGILSSFPIDATKGYMNEMTNLTNEGFIDMWSYFDGTKSIRWYNNITNITTISPGNFATKVLIAEENGTSINNANYWNWGANSGTTTCPSSAYKYSYNSSYTDAGWSNSHNSGGTTCNGWGYEASNYIGNWHSNTDCGACYSPDNHLFGNGASAYYCCGNSYDSDYLSFDLTSVFRDVSISNHNSNSNQLWVK